VTAIYRIAGRACRVVAIVLYTDAVIAADAAAAAAELHRQLQVGSHPDATRPPLFSIRRSAGASRNSFIKPPHDRTPPAAGDCYLLPSILLCALYGSPFGKNEQILALRPT